jgi:hypothetical protein
MVQNKHLGWKNISFLLVRFTINKNIKTMEINFMLKVS